MKSEFTAPKSILNAAQLKALRKPLPPAAVKQHPTKAYLSTIKAIYVTERLNDVFGVGAWRIYTKMISSTVGETARGGKEFTSVMKTVLTIPEYGIYYECIAGSSNTDEGDATKGGTTDAITKIGSYLGIGHAVFKGEYSHLNAATAYIAEIDTISELEAFWKENEKSFPGTPDREQFKNSVALRKTELKPVMV